MIGQEQGSERLDRWLARAKCSQCRVSFTCYPAGHYPRRQYQLDVVAQAVAAVAMGEGSGVTAAVADTAASATGVTAAVADTAASATSVRRWTRWVGTLIDPSAALACAAQLDPDSPAGAGLSALGTARCAIGGAVARVLGALEQLGVALGRRGIEVGARTGLGRVLEWQHRYHGLYVALVAEPHRLSPPMALGLATLAT